MEHRCPARRDERRHHVTVERFQRSPWRGPAQDMRTDIALVGLACRFPEADSPVELWENVLSQRRSFRQLPPSRLRAEDYLSEDRSVPDATYTLCAGLLEGYEFDRVRFRISGPTYRATDLTHWLALDVAADALADAGFPGGDGLPRTATGVVMGNSLTGEMTRAHSLRLRWPFVRRVVGSHLQGSGLDGHEVERLLESIEQSYKAPFPPIGEDSLAGALSNTIAGRICNFFDLNGGGWTVDGACSSSLLAVIALCGQLSSGDIDVGLAGGVDISLDPFELVGFAKTAALATGEMRVYDRRSTGFWPGEGCGVAVLMRADDAVAQGRRIYARIRGWGVSSDGAGGITRPETAGQVLALRRAYGRARTDMALVAYVEGHGTGTPVGDHVELETLAAFHREHGPSLPTVVGSVKANIGHTKAAAGLAGLIKTAMALQRGVLPPTTACDEPHYLVADGHGPLTVLRQAQPWPAGRPCAGVSGMGFGGVNAHVVLEAASSWAEPRFDGRTSALVRTAQDAELFLLAAPDAGDVKEQTRRLRERARLASWGELRDLAGALAAGVSRAPWRVAVVARSPTELQTRLDLAERLLGTGVGDHLDTGQGVFLGSGVNPPRIGFLFPGQGVTASIDGGAWSRRFPEVAAIYRDAGLFRHEGVEGTAVAQPAIATAYLAGHRVLEAVGIEATVAVGHSLGELCAFQWAGAMPAGDLLSLVRARAAAMESTCPPGTAMASLAADADATRAMLTGTGVSIAAVNSPRQAVVAGFAAEVDEVMERARRAGVPSVRLRVAHAFHTPLMRRTGELLERLLAKRSVQALSRRVISTVTGEVLGPGTDVRRVIVEHVTGPVRFRDAAERAALEVDVFVEVGPGRVLSGLVDGLGPALPLDVGGDSLRGLLSCLGALHAMGAPLRARALFDDRMLRPFDLTAVPRLLANPCEEAPADTPSVSASRASAAPDAGAASPALPSPPAPGQVDMGQLVRTLVARRAELPVEAVGDGDRLLDDLHMSSVTVGQIVQEAMEQLSLPPSTAPTNFANATLGELCDALRDLTAIGPEQRNGDGLDGIAPWVRPYRVDYRPEQTPSAPATGGGEWTVLTADAGDALGHRLRATLARATGRRGVATCLGRGPRPGPADVELLVQAAHRALAGKADAFLVVQHGGGGSAFARSLFQEHPRLAVSVVDLEAGVDDDLAAAVAAEAVSRDGFLEVRVGADGTRRAPFLTLADRTGPRAAPLSAADVLLVTGGGKGIAVECALALARATGARLALLGRSQPGADAALDANLARLTEAGLEVAYQRADVADADQVGEALAALEASVGPVTAILHGAGVNVPMPVAALGHDEIMATLGPKVTGLRNVVAAVDPRGLHLLVAFGSLIARTGLRGEAHYGLANEWLALEVERIKARLPACRCLTLEWSVWSGAGMAERLGVVEALTREGIQPIPLAQALSSMNEVLWQPRLEGPVVLTGRFGQASESALQRAELPLRRFLEHVRVHYPAVELVVDSTLAAETDPYLIDHRLDGNHVMPAALLLEAMAQAVSALTDWSSAVSFHDVEFSHPVVVGDEGRVELRVVALADTDKVDVAVRAGTTHFLTDHVKAVCRAGRAGGGDTSEGADLPPGAPRPTVDVDRDLYGSLLFQAGRFRRLRRYLHLQANRCLAEVDARHDGWFGPFLPSQLLLGDPGVHDAALHCVQACIPDTPVLPVGAGAIDLLSPLPADRVLVEATERARSATEYRYDIDITTVDGDLCERWTDVRFRPASRPLSIGDIPEALLGVVLERRIQDLLSDTDIRLALELDGGERKASSDAAFSRLLEDEGLVTRGSDGRPTAEGAVLSAAHTRGLTLAVAAPRAVACDIEHVAARSEGEWRALLGPRRWQLAQAAANAAGLTASAAGAIVWAAGECLVKAGLAPQSHLAISSSFPDKWLVMTCARHRIAATALNGEGGLDVALAVLAERAKT